MSTVVVQCLSCLTSSWMFGAVGELGGYSLWAPAVMHFVWNQLNPKVLGKCVSVRVPACARVRILRMRGHTCVCACQSMRV